MGGVGHVREGEDQRMPNGQSEAQIAFGVNWGVAQPSQTLPYVPQTRLTRDHRDKEVTT
jgi:hypothetical protein